MAERTEGAFPDRILLPVTAAIYHNGEEKPAMRWSFEMVIGVESDKELFDFVIRFREGFGIGDRCSQLIMKIHSQEQWNAAIAKVLQRSES